MGLRRVGDLLRLPRQKLRERLGPRRVDWLERLLSETPDPRLPFVPPAEYRGYLELPAAVELAQALVFPCRRLLAELGGFRLGRQAGVQRLDWRFGHAPGMRGTSTLSCAWEPPSPWLTRSAGWNCCAGTWSAWNCRP